MEIGKELLEILVCPTCKGKLRYAKTQLTCGKCGSYPIKDGVPVLLPKDQGKVRSSINPPT